MGRAEKVVKVKGQGRRSSVYGNFVSAEMAVGRIHPWVLVESDMLKYRVSWYTQNHRSTQTDAFRQQ